MSGWLTSFYLCSNLFAYKTNILRAVLQPHPYLVPTHSLLSELIPLAH